MSKPETAAGAFVALLRERGNQQSILPEHDILLAAAVEIERLRAGLHEVREFLSKPEWGTWRYMEGSDVYADKDAALFNISYALGETNDR